jgi:hypothetical protein
MTAEVIEQRQEQEQEQEQKQEQEQSQAPKQEQKQEQGQRQKRWRKPYRERVAEYHRIKKKSEQKQKQKQKLKAKREKIYNAKKEAAEIRRQTAAQLPPPRSLSRSQAKKRLAILAERLNTTPKDLVSRLPPGITLCDGGLESLEYQAEPTWKKVFADIVETVSLA